MDTSVSGSVLYFTLVLLSLCRGITGTTFTVVNRCGYTIWPGILSNAGSQALDSTGFQLQPGGSRSFQSPPSWSGRFWGRTGCTFDPTTSQGSCLTGDCSSNQVECNGLNANPPVTLAEFTIQLGNQDFYDVSLVDGYNLPMVIEPNGGSGSCLSTGCIADLNLQCPAELRADSGQACKSACGAFGTPEYCCSGTFGSPDTCKPSVYSEMFKASCPRAYSYAFDDATSTYTCAGADYVVTFCPSSSSQKSASNTSPSTTTTTTTTTNGSGTGTVVTETSGEEPTGIDTSWLPDFLTGNSSDKLSCSSWLFTVMASTLFLFSTIYF